MRMIVIGGSGLIGRSLLDEAARGGLTAIGTAHTHAGRGLVPFDARTARLADVVPGLNADDWVILLAAYIDPEWVRRNPAESRALNVDATCRLIDEGWSRGAKILFVSSEAVFDGVRGGYGEDDVPNPLTLYARQKIEVERHITAGAGRWAIVRTGWTIDPDALEARCPIAGTYNGLLSGDARMANDNIFTLTDVHDTAKAICRIVTDSMLGYHHVVAAPPVLRTDLARWIKDASQNGHRMELQSVPFDSLIFAEPRPARPWLSNERFVARTGMTFRNPRDIVRAKVALLDAQTAEPKRAAQ